RVLGLRTLHAGVEGLEEPDGVRLEEPHVQIVVMEGRWLRRRMTLHWSVEGLPKQSWALFDPCRERDEPLGADELKLVADRSIEQDLGLHRIHDRAEERPVHEVDPHSGAIRVLNAEDTGEIAVAERDDGIVLLVERLSSGRALSRHCR